MIESDFIHSLEDMGDYIDDLDETAGIQGDGHLEEYVEGLISYFTDQLMLLNNRGIV